MKKFNLIPYEVLTETSNGILVGGFSAVAGGGISNGSLGTVTNKDCPVMGNNCNGHNCARACSGKL